MFVITENETEPRLTAPDGPSILAAMHVSDGGDASGPRRIIAVFLDGVAFFAIWALTGIFLIYNSMLLALGIFMVLDVAITACTGASLGRLVAGIRVVGADGGPPRLRAAAIRAGLVLITGVVGMIVWMARAADGREAASRMWWDTAAGTFVEAVSPPRPQPSDPRAAALAGFDLEERDLVANSNGRLSNRQRMRNTIRATAYALGFVPAAPLPVLGVVSWTHEGFSLKALALIVFGPVIALGVLLYALEIWRDVISGRVLAIDGVPEKRVEEDSSESGLKWRFPYLRLRGDHKLGWHAYNSIRSDSRYRIYVLPSSGRCVAAEPLDG